MLRGTEVRGKEALEAHRHILWKPRISDHVFGQEQIDAVVHVERLVDERQIHDRSKKQETTQPRKRQAAVRRSSGGFQAGQIPTEDPTHVNASLKSTPSIAPRESRQRFWASTGRGAPPGRRNIIRISTLTPPPSAASSAGAYSIFSCRHHELRSPPGMRATSSGVGSIRTPPPANENSGFST